MSSTPASPIQTTEAGLLLDRGLTHLIEIVGRQAVEHKDTIMIGRTHGVHAEPTTFGLKLAVWYDELRRHLRRLDLAREDMAVGKISGAVGTHAHVPPDVETDVCATLGLQAAPASTQVLQRDRHAFFLAVLSGIGGDAGKDGGRDSPPAAHRGAGSRGAVRAWKSGFFGDAAQAKSA